jgi:hypothetical protein
MSRQLVLPSRLGARPFRGSNAIAAGLLTRAQLRGSAFQRVFPDTYLRADVPLTHQIRSIAAVVWAGGQGVVSGRSAACMYGVDVLARDAPIELTIPPGVHIRARHTIRLVRSPLVPADVSRQMGVLTTVPVRTAFDVARRDPLVEAVVCLDAMAAALLVDVEQVCAYADGRLGWPGCRAVPVVLSTVEPRTESPMESRTRVAIVAAGLPRPIAQFVVFDSYGRFVARLDFAYPERRVGIEYQGDHHRESAQYRADLRRANLLRELGWTLLQFGPADVLGDPTRMIALIRASLTSAVKP